MLQMMRDSKLDLTMFIRMFANEMRRLDDQLRASKADVIPPNYVQKLIGGSGRRATPERAASLLL